MAFQVSPGVNVREIDLTTVVPAVSTTVGAVAGVFSWGPAEQRVLIGSETSLIKIFGKPTADNFETFYTAANFLAYGNALYVVRAIDSTAKNAQALQPSTNATATAIAIKNLEEYEANTLNGGISDTLNSNVYFYARCPGVLGNSLKISVCDSSAAYSSVVDLSFDGNDSIAYNTVISTSTASATTISTSKSTSKSTATTTVLNTTTTFDTTFNTTFTTTPAGTTLDTSVAVVGGVTSGTGTFTIGPNSNTANVVVTSSDGSAAATACAQDVKDSITIGDYLRVANTTQYMKVSAVSNTTVINATSSSIIISFENKYTGAATATATGSQLTRYWEFYNNVDSAPGQSDYVAAFGNTSAQDELHIVVVDEDGLFTGVKNNVLEVFEGVSRATNAKSSSGASLYYKTVLENESEYLFYGSDIDGAATATAALVQSSTNVKPYTASFASGADTAAEGSIALADLANAYDLFKDPDIVDVSLVMTGRSSTNLANYVIDNIAEGRKDCVAFISPEQTDKTADNIVAFRDLLSSTSYAVIDSGYKYQYDRYNDVYRYIPLNGDIAGLCARTDQNNDPWYSPAGYSRGIIKNIVRLNFNPIQADRDLLYKNGINPVVTFPGQGTVLFGDKTMLTKPSAFDRINVRRLFIVLEKAIATAAKFALFEFNDEFTRAQFRNLVEPYLRDIQGRRGITDFKVVCDASNNTGEVIDRSEFVGDIYVKPTKSINYIQLNFVAVRSGVEFNEIVGA
jgi:phage tail sheath protein FI